MRVLEYLLEKLLMHIRAKKPEFVAVDGEYVVPIRFSEEIAHNLMTGWHPIGIGHAYLRPRDDGSFDLFVRTADLAEELKGMNMVSLDSVQNALLASLDLARSVLEGPTEYDPDTIEAAEQVRSLVMLSAD